MPDHTLLVDDIEELDTSKSTEINTKLSSYLADDVGAMCADGKTSARHREPFYCKELGFAMEKIKDGYKLADLWEVVPMSVSGTSK